MIPKQEWGTAAAQRFFDGLAGEVGPTGQSKPTQEMACTMCLTEDAIVSRPQTIFIVDGNSLCEKHAVWYYEDKQRDDMV